MNIGTISGIMKNAERVHFIGIGGISMSSLAMITKKSGYTVTGSDKTPSELTEKLEKSGIEIKYYHAKENIDGASLAVYTSAVKSGNPELDGAKEEGIPLCSRADYLGWLMSDYRVRIGVAGTHGKSTVTSMLSEIYMAAELDPTIVSGAVLDDIGGAYRIGNKEHFIFEACEYCDSFLSFFPTTAVITNVEYDHADYFKTMDQLTGSFVKFANIADRAMINLDDVESVRLKDKCTGKVTTYSVSGEADYRAENIEFVGGCAEFDLVAYGEKKCRIALRVPGKHNVSNALAACAAALEDGVSPEAAARGLNKYHGAKRRFEYMGTLSDGAEVYNDYAHHPSEIRATVNAAMQFGKRIVCVFQPHTYSRTVALFDQFTKSFAGADSVIFADIYAARETNEWGVCAEQLAEKAENGLYVGDFAAIADHIAKNCGKGDMVLILGAGDIIKLGEILLGK